ncbi:MAG: hypothetical protein WBD87_07780 [Candidatus Acidiferrales bacterium]
MSPPVILVPLFADAGIPMIALTWPLMLILLIPIIVVESLLCKKWLGLTTWEAMKSNACSNLLSTVVGIPMAWAAMFAVELGVSELTATSTTIANWHSPLANVVSLLLGSAWLGPAEGKDVWIIPAATMVLLIPFFFASYGIEYLVLHFMVGMPEGGPPNLAYPRVRIAVRNANLVTYGAMFVAASIWLMVWLPYR